MKTSRFLFLSILLLSTIASAQINVTVTTNKDTYILGEPVQIFITATNKGDEDVTLEFPNSGVCNYRMDGVYTPIFAHADVLTDVVIPAGESKTWSFRHNLEEYPLEIGDHRVSGTILNVGRGRAEFEVVEGEAMEEDILIDFTPPSEDDSEDADSEAWVYASWAIEFRSAQDPDQEENPAIGPSLTEDEGNYYLKVGRCTYPPGYNIIADFQYPIAGASMRVSSAAECTVTVIAKDADGNVLHTAESPEVSAVGEFVAIPEFRTDTPIASLEWWPSDERATVMVDDLLLIALPAEGDDDDDADSDEDDDADDDDEGDDDNDALLPAAIEADIEVVIE
jgi:hypothetical protein